MKKQIIITVLLLILTITNTVISIVRGYITSNGGYVAYIITSYILTIFSICNIIYKTKRNRFERILAHNKAVMGERTSPKERKYDENTPLIYVINALGRGVSFEGGLTINNMRKINVIGNTRRIYDVTINCANRIVYVTFDGSEACRFNYKTDGYKMFTHTSKTPIVVENINDIPNISDELFIPNVKYNDKLNLFIVKGDSNTAKTYMSSLMYLDGNIVEYTDEFNTLEEVYNIDLSKIDVLVIGNKHKVDYSTIVKMIPDDRTVVNIDYSKG